MAEAAEISAIVDTNKVLAESERHENLDPGYLAVILFPSL